MSKMSVKDYSMKHAVFIIICFWIVDFNIGMKLVSGSVEGLSVEKPVGRNSICQIF